MRKILMIFAALLGLVAAAGCADDPPVADDASPAPVATVGQSESATEAQDPGEAARLYIEALARTDDPRAMRDGLDHAAEGSTAHAYLSHRANLAEASLDGGTPLPEFDMTPTGDGFELCEPNATYEGACGVFADFEATPEGLITDITVDGENPGPRLTVGNGETVKDSGTSAKFLTAYDSVTGSGLWVAVRVASGSEPVDLWLYQATYRAPDGGQRQATDALGPIELGADSNTTVAMVFAGVEPGGTVTLGGADSTDFNEFELQFKVG